MKSGDLLFYETPPLKGTPVQRIREAIKRCTIAGSKPAGLMVEVSDLETIFAERDAMLTLLKRFADLTLDEDTPDAGDVLEARHLVGLLEGEG